MLFLLLSEVSVGVLVRSEQGIDGVEEGVAEERTAVLFLRGGMTPYGCGVLEGMVVVFFFEKDVGGVEAEDGCKHGEENIWQSGCGGRAKGVEGGEKGEEERRE